MVFNNQNIYYWFITYPLKMSSSCFCQTKRAKTMADIHRANYEHMMQSPLIVHMQNRIVKLEREKRSLLRAIVHLSDCLDKKTTVVHGPDDVSGLSDDDTVVSELPKSIHVHKIGSNENTTPNIVYELIDLDTEEEEEGCEVEAVENSDEVEEKEGCEVEEVENSDETEEEAEEEEEEAEEAEEEEEEEEEEEGCEVEGCEVEGCEVEGCEVEGCDVEGCEVEAVENSDEAEEEAEEEEDCEVEEAEDCEVEEAEDCEVEEAEDCEVEAVENSDEAEVEGAVEPNDANETVEEETEVVEITIRGKKYFTTNTTNGEIYAMDANGDVGDEVGQFVNGSAKFHKK